METSEAPEVSAVLEDTQASLAAALARIEGFRLREKQLLSEISQLREKVQQLSKHAPDKGDHDPVDDNTPQTPIAKIDPNWTSVNSKPVFVTICEGEYPLRILTGLKKVPGSLVITPEFIDFVEFKARVRQEDFVGITHLKTSQDPETAEEREDTGRSSVWQVIWKNKSGFNQRLNFEASQSTRENIHRHMERWLGEVPDSSIEKEVSSPPAERENEEVTDLVPARMMAPVAGTPPLVLQGPPSQLLRSEHLAVLAAQVPPMERMREWSCSYSTYRHGTSLQTLYRRVAPHQPCLLVIRDFGGYLFGCYTPDSWRMAPRFYGSGETFVFQLEPSRVAYPWQCNSSTKNDYFMYGTLDCLAVGGQGRFAIWLDNELQHGSSGACGTFGSTCLAQAEDFGVQAVELWQAV